MTIGSKTGAVCTVGYSSHSNYYLAVVLSGPDMANVCHRDAWPFRLRANRHTQMRVGDVLWPIGRCLTPRRQFRRHGLVGAGYFAKLAQAADLFLPAEVRLEFL